MAATAAPAPVTCFQTSPAEYKHWTLTVEGDIATLLMHVQLEEGQGDNYELKLNSYDLGVDIELNDAIQRLRFEHPEVRTVVLTGGLDRVFCAGANIIMLRTSSHAALSRPTHASWSRTGLKVCVPNKNAKRNRM